MWALQCRALAVLALAALTAALSVETTFNSSDVAAVQVCAPVVLLLTPAQSNATAATLTISGKMALKGQGPVSGGARAAFLGGVPLWPAPLPLPPRRCRPHGSCLASGSAQPARVPTACRQPGRCAGRQSGGRGAQHLLDQAGPSRHCADGCVRPGCAARCASRACTCLTVCPGLCPCPPPPQSPWLCRPGTS